MASIRSLWVDEFGSELSEDARDRMVLYVHPDIPGADSLERRLSSFSTSPGVRITGAEVMAASRLRISRSVRGGWSGAAA